MGACTSVPPERIARSPSAPSISPQCHATGNTEEKVLTSNISSARSSKYRKRKEVRSMTFEPDPEMLTHDSFKSITYYPSSCAASSDDRDLDIMENTDVNLPILPIRFTKSEAVWNTEYTLFVQYLAERIYRKHQNDENEEESTLQITKTILQFAATDWLFQSGSNAAYSSNRGLWPQHVILHEAQTHLNAFSMLEDKPRDELVHSFKLQHIFEIAGNHFHAFSSTATAISDFFVYGVGFEPDGYLSSPSLMDDYAEPTHTMSRSIYINPLKFKIYSHNIMVCDKGFHVERHNEFYQEATTGDHDAEKLGDDAEPSYYFTLLLIPPNISSYTGGQFKFYGVRDATKYASFTPTPTPQAPVPVLEDKETNSVGLGNVRPVGSLQDHVQIRADKHAWTWILFDKRVHYECGAILDGTAVAFKMDIDVWKKTEQEIKQNEVSLSMMHDVMSGQLNIDISKLLSSEEQSSFQRQRTNSNESTSPTPSANLVFYPNREELVEYVLDVGEQQQFEPKSN
eukprot:CAMPEP_0197080230 /NCGR_PEP_ID=MMETSP1384-20130603/214024_1 /TAXON_ID=29189 /ORGANISM="Ammonia sp." /LENGTH=512 /DNA_ID=CAMNT_0042519113 /DNA_START=672 /DNA_END=2210 /DNA_ORIENTATION=-